MGKKHRDETEEERKARKRARKEAKKKRKEEKRGSADTQGVGEASENRQDGDRETASPTSVSPNVALPPVTSTDSLPVKVPETGLNSSRSPFERKKLDLVVSLFPVSMENVLMHVQKSIRSLLLKYSDGFGGVLLAFENVRIKGDKSGENGYGWILNEMPYIHYPVELEALVFCPSVGTKLIGVVNECFPSHVGMLIHSFFNAMVSSDHLQSAGYFFDQDLNQWIMEKDAKVLGIDDKVGFTVEKLHECAGVISLEGSHPSVCYR